MPAPIVSVEIGLDLGDKDTGAMVLDDATRGVLDGIYYLSGNVFYDVSESIINAGTNRGKSQALDRIDAGILNVSFNNHDRLFDPLYAASPYYGALTPRRQIKTYANGLPVFVGFIDDFDITYEQGGRSIATLQASDAFSVLANAKIDQTFPDVELSGARVTRILNLPEVDWDSTLRDIETGSSTMLDTTIAADTPALEYLQLVAESEFGNLFLSKDGKVTFDGRNTVPLVADLVISDEKVAGVFTGIPFTDIQVVYGSENLYNRVIISNSDTIPDEAISEDLDSQLYYGIRTYTKSGLLNLDPLDLANLSNFLLLSYSQPQYRFESVSVLLDDLSLTDQNKMLGLEIGDIIEVHFTPSGIAPAIEQFVKVIGIGHDWRIDSKVINLQLQRLDFGLFILDNAFFGVLDSDRLAY